MSICMQLHFHKYTKVQRQNKSQPSQSRRTPANHIKYQFRMSFQMPTAPRECPWHSVFKHPLWHRIFARQYHAAHKFACHRYFPVEIRKHARSEGGHMKTRARCVGGGVFALLVTEKNLSEAEHAWLLAWQMECAAQQRILVILSSHTSHPHRRGLELHTVTMGMVELPSSVNIDVDTSACIYCKMA